MAILPIRITGDPVLHQPAEPITRFDDELRTLVSDMYETMLAAPGVGLAAPQVGVPLRLFVYNYPDEQGNDRRGVAINPELWISPPPTAPRARRDRRSRPCPRHQPPLAAGILPAQEPRERWGRGRIHATSVS